MATQLDQLSSRVGTLDQGGIDRALEIAANDPKQAAIAADLLRQDPKGVVRHVLILSTEQDQALAGTADEELKKMLSPLADALDSGRLEGVKVEYSLVRAPGDVGTEAWKIKCNVDISF